MFFKKMKTALDLEVEAVNEFYCRVGYPHRAHRGDSIVVAMAATEIMGAVRLVREQGTQVLRGMQVDPRYHGQGVGTEMLRLLDQFFTPLCFCIPYEHLSTFYAQARFRVAEPRDVPEFLLERYFEYLKENPDQKYVIMVR